MSSSKSFSLSEDWIVVILGLGIIFFALAGVIVPKPAFDWANTGELQGQVFSAKNITAIGLQFITVYIVAIVGAILLRKPLKSLLIVFPIVYFLTIFALVLAGIRLSRNIISRLSYSVWP